MVGSSRNARRGTCAAPILAALALSACSGLASKDPDFTPVNPTAVRETRVVSGGTRDFPEFESTRVSYTRADKRRNESSVRNSSASSVAGEQKDIVIELLDQNIGLKLDASNRKAIKCPLARCAERAPAKSPTRQLTAAARSQKSACRLKVGSSALSVEPTGRKRNVNGFSAEQYDVKWIVTLRDNAAHESTSTISIDLWTTPMTPALQDAIALEQTYASSLDKILGSPSDANHAQFLPSEAALLIDRYLYASVTPADRKKFLGGAQGLHKAKGHPVLMHLKWHLSGDACSTGDSLKNLGDKPLFTFMSEVKVHTMAPLHESLFMPPRGYRVR